MKDGNSLKTHKLSIRVSEAELIALKHMAANGMTSIQRIVENAIEAILKIDKVLKEKGNK